MGFTLNQLEQERQIKKLQKKEDKDTKDYEKLDNLPSINSVELKGNKTTSDLGINADNVMMSDGLTSVQGALDEVKSGLSNTWSLSGGVSLPANTDLNTLIKVGNYYAVSNNAASITNKPTTGAFKLTVSYDVRETAPGYVEQVFNPLGSYDEFRRWTGDEGATWSDWKLTNIGFTAPDVDGTYTLKATVSSGVISYNWVSDTP